MTEPLPSPDASALRQRLRDTAERGRAAVVDVSRRIHAEPELAYEEVAAAGTLVAALGDVAGARVQAGLGTLPTAFRAEAGSGPLTVTLCAEYDALPEIGHACGHNIIAASAFGAFAALAPLADELGLTVRLLGTPAEERGGGKVDLLREGFFDGSHAVLMIHPWEGPTGPIAMRTRASCAFRMRFSGQPAHASSRPWAGVNALDAMTIALTAIGLARQQLRPGQQIHGFVDHAGSASNVIPESAEGEWMIRADTAASLKEVHAVLLRCFEAGAHATGAALEVIPIEHVYAEMTNDPDLCAVFTRVAAEVGRPFVASSDDTAGSSDIANVSACFPTIHPCIGLGEGVPGPHTAPFTAVAGGPLGDRASIDGALLLALTAADVALDDGLRARLLARPPVDTSTGGTDLDLPLPDRRSAA